MGTEESQQEATEGEALPSWMASLDGEGRYLPRGDFLEEVWQLTLGFEEVGGRLYPARLELGRGRFHDQVPPGGITARLLHRIRLGELIDAYRLERKQDETIGELIFGRPRPSYPMPPKANRPGPRGLGEAFYQDVAVAYLQSMATDPRRPIEAMLPRYLGYSKANVRDWVAKARSKGYLSAPGQGQPGGEPTKALLEALAAQGRDAPPSARPRASEDRAHPNKEGAPPRARRPARTPKERRRTT